MKGGGASGRRSARGLRELCWVDMRDMEGNEDVCIDDAADEEAWDCTHTRTRSSNAAALLPVSRKT